MHKLCTLFSIVSWALKRFVWLGKVDLIFGTKKSNPIKKNSYISMISF